MEFYVYEGFLSPQECEEWCKRKPILPDKHWRQMTWKERRIDLTNDPVVQKVLDFQKEVFGMETTCYEAAFQVFPETSWSYPHIHTMSNRLHEDYTSLVYLNDDYHEGELFTVKCSEEFTLESPVIIRSIEEVELVFKPKKGTLIMFDAKRIYHGINRVRGGDRHSLVFWFHSSTFADSRREAYNVERVADRFI